MISVYKKTFDTSQRFKPRESLPYVLPYLSEFLSRPVSSDEIIYTTEGKPALKYAEANFSISHSDRYLAIACSTKCKVGLDIQVSMAVSQGILNATVSENEQKQLKWLKKEVNFFDVWCIKEATLKLLGSGLDRTLNTMETHFEGQFLQIGEPPLRIKYEKLSLFPDVFSYVVSDSDFHTRDIQIK